MSMACRTWSASWIAMLTMAMMLIHTIFRSIAVTGLAVTVFDISLMTRTSLSGHSCAEFPGSDYKLVKRPNEPGGHDLAVVAEIKVGLDVPGICRVLKAPAHLFPRQSYSRTPSPRSTRSPTPPTVAGTQPKAPPASGQLSR